MNLGVIGKTYEIQEEDFVLYMQKTVSEQGDKTKELNEMMLENGKRYLQRPPGISLPRAERYFYHEYDPTYTVPQDIYDDEGSLLYVAGTQVNPLNYVSLRQSLCFFDGDDEMQLKWVLTYCSEVAEAKIILVNGPLGKIMEDYPLKRFFFDQRAILVRRFNIQNLPSVVRQSGKTLVIEEFPVDG